MSLQQLFLKSALTEESQFINTEDVLKWVKQRNDSTIVKVNQIPFSDLKNWYFDEKVGALRHQTGKFFSIEGINVKTNWGSRN